MVQTGRIRWVMRILVAVLIAVAFIAGKSTAVSAAPQQTHMEMALDALKSAKTHLGEADADKGGHRARAIKLVDQATASRNAQKKASLKTGENFMIVNGERFHNEKIILKPHLTGYDNDWNEYGKEKFTDIDLNGNYDGRYLEFQFRVPGQMGVYTIEDNRTSTGSQSDVNNCTLLLKDKDTYGDGLDGETGSVKVKFTRYDNVGGLIEGNFTGTLVTDTRKNTTISISGNFSVIRDKDRKGPGAVTN